MLRTVKLSCHTRDVFAGTGINFDQLALVDEDRNLDFSSALDNRRLKHSTGSRVATVARCRFYNAHLHESRRLDGNRDAVVKHDVIDDVIEKPLLNVSDILQ